MTTPDLFDEDTAPFQRHSATSRAAAVAVQPKLSDLQSLVLTYLRFCGLYGATDQEMQDRIPMNASTQRPRRIELDRRGLIVMDGTTRPTRSGRRAVVWRAKQ